MIFMLRQVKNKPFYTGLTTLSAFIFGMLPDRPSS